MAMGPIMAIGGVDMLIPPSALTVLLGSLSGISISRLLVAGIVPGVLLAASFVGYIVVRAHLDAPARAPGARTAVRGWERWRPLIVYVTPLVAIFVVVVLAMTAGWATPTESAAVGAVATVLVGWLYRSLTWAGLAEALRSTAAISGVILFIIIGATTFSQVLTFSGATNGLVASIREAQPSGRWLDGHAGHPARAGLLHRPGEHDADHASVLHAAGRHYGFDPVWFGVLFLICMQLGLLTPPFGMLLFTMKSVAPPEITMGQIFRAVTPYVTLGLAALAAVILWPALATWLPRCCSGK